MAERDAHKKPVTAETSPELVGSSQPKFNKQDFDDTVYDKGYHLHIEKANRCPCRIKANDSPIPSCKNCGGIGWFFVNKKSTRGVVQAMNRTVKNAPWTESDRGTVSVSLRDDDKVAFMDRITQTELLSYHSEVLTLRRSSSNRYYGSTIYLVGKIEFAYLFEKDDTKLYPIPLTDITIDDYQVVVNMDLSQYDEPRVSIRYEHNPQFLVIDITREQVSGRGSLPSDGNLQDPITDRLGTLPVHCVARRAHYIFDQPDRSGDSLFDNSIPAVE